MQQPTLDHFAELRRLLQAGLERNSGTIPTSTYCLAPSVQPLEAASGAADWKPPRAPPPLAAITQGRTRRPAAVSLLDLLKTQTAKEVSSRPAAAGWGDVRTYLASRNEAPKAGMPPTATFPENQRRAKRGKPMARRSLQALFDAAAEDSSTWQTSASGDAEEDTDTSSGIGMSADAILCGRTTPSPRHPCTIGPGSPTSEDCSPKMISRQGSPLPGSIGTSDPNAPAASVSLGSLLSSARGRRMSVLEAKAIIYRIVCDLNALHAANLVHRRVALESITLDCSAAVAVATLPLGASLARVGSARCYWAPREPGTESQAPPEVARCPQDRAAYTPQGDMWGLGVVMFGLLAAGQLPFGQTGLCSESLRAGQSVDAMQMAIEQQLIQEMDAVNLAKGRQADLAFDQDTDCHPLMGFEAEAKDLLLGLLRMDPAQRFTATQVLTHPWIAEVIPFVPEAHSKVSIRNSNKTDGVSRGSTPGLSSIMRQTEQLRFGPSLGAHAAVPNTPMVGVESIPASGQPPACPYPVIGHVAQPIEVTVDAQNVIMSALHAVYAVPGHGAMMGATPVAVVHPDEVEAAAALLAPRQHVQPSA